TPVPGQWLELCAVCARPHPPVRGAGAVHQLVRDGGTRVPYIQDGGVLCPFECGPAAAYADRSHLATPTGTVLGPGRTAPGLGGADPGPEVTIPGPDRTEPGPEVTDPGARRSAQRTPAASVP